MEFLWMKKRVGEYQSQEGEQRFLKVVAMFGSLKKNEGQGNGENSFVKRFRMIALESS